jgi:hypothetical protein
MRFVRLVIVLGLVATAASCKKGGHGYLKTAPQPVMQR